MAECQTLKLLVMIFLFGMFHRMVLDDLMRLLVQWILIEIIQKKAQELDDPCRGIDILDTIVIEDNNFVDEDLKLASSFDLAKQVRYSPLFLIKKI